MRRVGARSIPSPCTRPTPCGPGPDCAIAAAVEVLVSEGPARVRELAALGAVFDRNDQGVWELAREGGHSTARVVHAGGAATGAEVERTLVGRGPGRPPPESGSTGSPWT